MPRIIADQKQIQFLLLKLEDCTNKKFTNRNDKHTKASLSPLADIYKTELVKKYKPEKPYNKPSRLLETTGENIFNLVQSDYASANNICIQQLAGLALYLQDIVTDITECAKKIHSRTAWDEFLKHSKPEMNSAATYMFYYWQDNICQLAVVELTFNEEHTQWIDCSIIFYDYDAINNTYSKNTIKTEVKILNNELPNKENQAFSFYIIHDWQIAQYTICIPGDIYNRKLFICSYSSYNRSGQPLSGIGILEKCGDTEKKVHEINRSKKIDDYLFNALYEKNALLNFDNSASTTLPNAAEIREIKTISGTWIAYSLRNSKPQTHTGTEEMGGIEMNYLHIEPNGIVNLRSDDSGAPGYTGFLRYPISDNNRFVKCNILESPQDKIYKIHLLLTIHDNKKILEGVMAGWSKNGEPFASLIKLKRADAKRKNDTDEADVYEPKFFAKKEISNSSEIDESLLYFLRNNSKYLDLAEECLPLVHAGNMQLYKNLSGKFYLVSRDFDEGLIDKAKLELFDDGLFKVEYPDVSYTGMVKEFISDGDSEHYIYLDISGKKLNIHKKWKEFSGSLMFNTGKLLISQHDKLSERIETLIGFSLRKNVNHFLQVKKEIIIPALSADDFDNEKAHKYNYSEEDKIIANFKHYPDDKVLKIDYFEVLKNLRGKENNIMLLAPDQTTLDTFRETDYFEVYMNAFLFETLFTRQLDYPRIYNYLIQALLHLDNPKKIIQKLTRIFSKYKTKQTIQKQITGEIGSLLHDITDRANEGKLNQILITLKHPMAHEKKIPVVIKINGIIQKIRMLL